MNQILSKEDFSIQVDRKAEFSELLHKEERHYYDNLIWEEDEDLVKISKARQSGFKADIAAIDAALDFTKANITKDELHAYKVYHYDRKGIVRYNPRYNKHL